MTNAELLELIVLIGLGGYAFLIIMLWRIKHELDAETKAHERDKALLDKTLAERDAVDDIVCGCVSVEQLIAYRDNQQPLPYKLEPDTPEQQGTSDKGGSAQRRAVSYP